MPFHDRVFCWSRHARQGESWNENDQDVEHLQLVAVVIEPKNKINEEDSENGQVHIDCEQRSLLYTFSQTSSFSKDREETVDVCVCLENESAGKSIDRS